MKARIIGASAFARWALEEYFYVLKQSLVFLVLLLPAVFRFLFARVELVREISPHHAPLEKHEWERASYIELINKS